MATHSDFQRRVQRYGWDKAATFYEQYWKDALQPAQAVVMEYAALYPNAHVLDVACGTGLVTVVAAQAVGKAGSVVGTDLSSAMVSATIAAAADAGLTNVSVERADAEVLPFPDASFDVVLCALGLMYVPNPQRAIQEMFRVLKVGGRCVVSVWGQRDRCGWAELFPIVDHRVTSEVCPMFFQLGGQDALEDALQIAAFTNVECRRIETILHYASADDACGAAFLGGPVALAYARFDEPTRTDVHAEYLQSIERYRTDQQYHIPGEFVIVRGVKP